MTRFVIVLVFPNDNPLDNDESLDDDEHMDVCGILLPISDACGMSGFA